MNKANKLVTTAFGALLAAQAPQAVGQESRQLAEPFRMDISAILHGEQGRLLRVGSIAEFEELYQPGSSVVVEGDYGLSDNVLSELQNYINTNYAHLNILVYLAERGGVSRRESDVCGTNDKLSGLRDAFFNTVATGGEGQDVILYLAGTTLDDPERMLCALISPNMAQLTGTDERIFSPGTPLFNSVVAQLRPDFNRVGAVKAFLRGLDERVQQAQRQAEQERASHIAQIAAIQSQLGSYTSSINGIVSQNIELEGSQIYQNFQNQYSEIQVLLEGEAQYISLGTINQAQRRMRDLEEQYNTILAAITGLPAARERLIELTTYSQNLQSTEYIDAVSSLNAELILTITQTQALIAAGNIDYFLSMGEVDVKYQAIENAIGRIKLQENMKKTGALGVGLSFLGTLVYFNRRTRRKLSRKQFLEEFQKLEVSFKETKRVFDEDISGNTESIEMFFGNPEGATQEKIKALKASVAYISVLLPKIEEILQKAKSSIGLSAQFKATPYDEALKMLSEDTHIIDPSQNEVDQKLLKKINGGNIQNLSDLIVTLSKTLPELIVILDENIDTTKKVFEDFKKASEHLEQEQQKNRAITQELSSSITELLGSIGVEFGDIQKITETFAPQISEIKGQGNENDIIGEYNTIVDLNQYITECISILRDINIFLQQNQPAKYRFTLQSAGYDTQDFLQDIQGRYVSFFQAFQLGLQERIFDISPVKEKQSPIFSFYQEMSELAKRHQNKTLAEERLVALKVQKGESETSIRTSLGERLKAEKLYHEEEYKLDEILKQVQELIASLGNSIQSRDLDGAGESQTKIHEAQDFIRDIIVRTDFVVDNFDINIGELETTRKNLEVEIEGISSQLDFLKENFSAEILILRELDFHAEDSDKDISNNVSETQAIFGQLTIHFTHAVKLFENAQFIQAFKLLETIYKLLESIDQRVQEVQLVHKNVTNTHTENPQTFQRLQSIFVKLNEKSKTSKTTQNTQNFIEQQEVSLTGIEELLKQPHPNPYHIEEILQDIEGGLKRASTELDRDQAEYQEYCKYVTLAKTVFGQLEKKATQAQDDNLPDSKEVIKIIGSIDDIQKSLERVSGYQDNQVVDWYDLTDQLETIIQLSQKKLDRLKQDDTNRDKAQSEIQDASKKVKQAKNWSGRYVSISNSIGENHLRHALSAYNTGDFTRAVQDANSAESMANTAISHAEDADRAEKRRRDAIAAAAAAERARSAARAARAAAAARSSSSSSSFGGGGGGSGFSGGRF